MNARLVSLISVLLAFTVPTTEAEPHANEYQAKAAYLYQMAKFIHWPELTKANAPIHFCVFGKGPLRGALNKVHPRKINNREVQLSYINQDFQITHCNILFVQQKISADFVQKHYSLITKNQVLTIGEYKGFAQQGGIIGFTYINEKFNVEINLQAAKDANIKVSANLIEIASQVHQGGQS